MKDYKWINTRRYFFHIKNLIATYLYLNGQKCTIDSFLIDEDKKTVSLKILEKFDPTPLYIIYTAKDKEEVDDILRSIIKSHDNRPDPFNDY